MESDVTIANPVVGLVVFLVMLGVFTWPYVRIVQKAGYSGWNILWMFVPVANLVMLFVFAFAKWPIEDKVARLEAKVF
jgi:putative effector of murein hydrolase LrgA (UPF0299 family)